MKTAGLIFFIFNLLFVLGLVSEKAVAQHKVFMHKAERVSMIQRLENEIQSLTKTPHAFSKDTTAFRKLDTLYVQKTQLNANVKLIASFHKNITDSLFLIARRYNWKEGLLFANLYKSQRLHFDNKHSEAYNLLQAIEKEYSHSVYRYRHCWTMIQLAEELIYRSKSTNEEQQKAINYLNKSLSVASKNMYWDVIHKANVHLGDLQMINNNYLRALPYFEKQVKMFQEHSNINIGYYNEAANYSNIGICHLRLGEEAKAKLYLDKFLEKYNPDYGEYSNYRYFAVLTEYCGYYLEKKEYKKALRYALLYEKYLSHRHLQDHKIHYERMYFIYKGLEKPGIALQFHEKLLVADDSLKTEELSGKFREIESLHQLENKEKRIQELQKSDLIKKNENQQLYLIGTIIISLAIILILIFVLRSYKLSKTNFQYKLRLSVTEKRIVNSVVQTQNEERDRIAKDLHDDLGGILATLNAKLFSLKIDSKNKEIKEIMEISSKASHRLRHIAHNLMPPEFEKSGVLESVRDRLSSIGNPVFHLTVFGSEKRMMPDRELNLFRILTELFSNIQKHSGAGKVNIQFFYHTELLIIVIEDDGAGNKNQAKSLQGGIGLKSIEFRLKYLNGHLVTDINDHGTNLILEIPYE